MTAPWTPATWRGPQGPIPVFATWDQAREHLCDHVLSTPEARLWPVLSPSLGELVGQGWADRVALARHLWSGHDDEHASRLYQCYAQAVLRALEEALDAGRVWTERLGRQAALSCSGVLVAWNQATVVTAYLPGFFYPEVAGDARPTPQEPLPRDCGEHLCDDLLDTADQARVAPQDQALRRRARRLVARRAAETVRRRLKHRNGSWAHPAPERLLRDLATLGQADEGDHHDL